MIEIARQDLEKLDRQIQFERELERQMPFAIENNDREKLGGRHSGTDGSPCRMQSPARQSENYSYEPSALKSIGTKGSNQVDDIEQIMQQMQTLNIEKKELMVHPVDEKTKIRVIRWLVDDVKLISNQLNLQKLLQDFPMYCRNGVLFGDLINRLQGRDEVIKGIHRAPKNMAAINANYEKVLGYLKEFPRF